MKKIVKLIGIIFLLCALGVSILVYGTKVSVNSLSIVNQKIVTSKINDSQDGLKIAFISDLHYNHFMNQKRLENMITKINAAKPDIILFGGDVFDDPSTYEISDETKNELCDLLKSLNAEYGKFAVLGEEDHDSNVSEWIEDFLFQCDFELLQNEHLLLSKNETLINLVGIDSLIGGNPDIENAFDNVDTSLFTIVLTHAPDLVTQLPYSGIDVTLAGHSHGGQIALPFFGTLTSIQGAEKYSKGTYHINNMELIVSNGLGTSQKDIRIFADPQCHILRLALQ